jgi:hypothetical protein
LIELECGDCGGTGEKKCLADTQRRRGRLGRGWRGEPLGVELCGAVSWGHTIDATAAQLMEESTKARENALPELRGKLFEQ